MEPEQIMEQVMNILAVLQIIVGLCMVLSAIWFLFRQKKVSDGQLNEGQIKSLAMLQGAAGLCTAFVGAGTLAGLVEYRITSLLLCLLVFIPALAYLIRNFRIGIKN